ncbi:TPA: phage repressor protein CI [Enterobacter hormaechei subsp. steigerwaltii]|uniref:phage repressor protein CI n=1 Tax=Citrobacter braakii TaxID=57706 RepID=UPI00193E56C0|nr:phage repressor protein CI [Citrobacter braakii]MBM3059938.1 phage repressor protein CI [Citrobacter braakii]MBM3064604.1 phage repressor protein CI [Citrobacter braakii]WBU74752.1 phage repressor protein CI [Citrobacter braakii]
MKINVSNLDPIGILDRICQVYGFHQKLQLANHFDIAASSLSNRYTRGTISYDFAAICALETGANLQWILTGKGERFAGEGVQLDDEHPSTQISKFTLSESQMTQIGTFTIDNSLIEDSNAGVFSIEIEGKLYVVEESSIISDGLKLIDIEGAISLRELAVLPGKKLHVTGGKVPFECSFDDIKVRGRVIGIYSEVK